MEIASEGCVSESYTLRYPIDLSNSFQWQEKASFKLIEDSISITIEPTPYGAMIVSRGHKTSEDAHCHALRLWTASRLFSVRRRIGLFLEQTIHHPKDTNLVFPAGWKNGSAAGWQPDHSLGTTVHGVIPETFAAIIPEHKRIVFYGEIRGQWKVCVSSADLGQQIEATPTPKTTSIDDQLELALNMFSIACSRSSPLTCAIHLSTTLEVISAAEGIKEKDGRAVRALLKKYNLEKTMPKDCSPGKNKTEKPLSTVIYALRSNIVHKGHAGDVNLFHILDEGLSACATILEIKLTQSV